MAIRGTDLILTEIPAYGAQTDEGFVEDLRANAQRTFELMVLSLRGAALTDGDFDFARASMSRRARRGLSLGTMCTPIGLGCASPGRRIESAVDDKRSRDAALSLIGPVLHFTDVSSTLVAAAFEEVDRILAASGERVRRDVLEDLLAGRVPRLGARDEAVRAAGLGPDHSHVVVSARPEVAGRSDDHVLFAAAGSLGRVVGQPVTPLSVFREDEWLPSCQSIRNACRSSPPSCASPRRSFVTRERLSSSAPAPSSTASRNCPRPTGRLGFAQSLTTTENSVSCLFELSASDYLTMTADDTAARLIRREVTEFVDEDLNGGGVLIGTLLAYANAGFNVKAASEVLYVHVNTAHARLDRIAERTGCDLRTLDGVNELRVAVELARARR